MALKALTAVHRYILKTSCHNLTIRNTSSYKWYQFIREPQPNDIYTVDGGIPVIVPPEPKLTKVVESRDPSEWKFVEDILPQKTVPPPPKHESYPTPSGWFPPKEPRPNEPYRVRRTRFHNFPLYQVVLNSGLAPYTVIRCVQGDVKQLERDVLEFLSGRVKGKIYTTANEVCRKLWIKGVHLDDMKEFLTKKGF